MARVMVAMSGGVDSSVTAGLLVEQGHEVIGVHMKLHDGHGGKGTCCGLDDALDARRVAERLGIPFYVLDLQDAFREAVIEPFADAWIAGRTPSPCVLCNGVLKFRVLLARALALGCDQLATGHYARVEEGPSLYAAVDPAKDQSYFLFPLTLRALRHTLMPLGGLTKPEVRAHAARMGLVTADKPESQDVCFLPDHDHARLVRALRPGVDGAGEIVDEEGRVLGQHDGWWRFTVGQRRGLAVALGFPAYVLRVEAETKRVVVAPEARLQHAGLAASGATWLLDPPAEGLSVRIRHRGPRVPCAIERDGDRVIARFHGLARAVTPGQAAVFYLGDRVVGGAWIDQAA